MGFAFVIQDVFIMFSFNFSVYILWLCTNTVVAP